jgi:hypothetical protein
MTIRTALQGHILLETPGDGGSGAGEPQQGQGADTDLYSPYLADVPAEMHPLVLDPLKRQNADFTRKFQEASQFRQQWEPYQQLGLHEMDPQEIEGLLSFREQISTDDGARQWFSQMAENEEAAKIFPEDAWEKIGVANGWLDEGDQLEEKLGNGNGATLNGGRPDTNPPKLSWNGGISPRDAALARLKQT